VKRAAKARRLNVEESNGIRHFNADSDAKLDAWKSLSGYLSLVEGKAAKDIQQMNLKVRAGRTLLMQVNANQF